jgi:hypothetical protein
VQPRLKTDMELARGAFSSNMAGQNVAGFQKGAAVAEDRE